jgi:hypothetical protein
MKNKFKLSALSVFLSLFLLSLPAAKVYSVKAAVRGKE